MINVATTIDSDVEAIDRVISKRFSNRFFCNRPVHTGDLRDILDVARNAPSGGNIQPWKVYALGGEVKAELSALMLAEHERNSGDFCSQYAYYPQELPEPYRDRKYQFGVEYYGGLGIDQGDAAARWRQSGRNFIFFDAPIGLIFTIDRRLEIGSWLDLGMFMQNIMLAAKARGMDTCPQEAFSRYHAILREHLPIGDSELVVCGMSVGYPDESRQSSRRCMKRAPLDDLASFHGL